VPSGTITEAGVRMNINVGIQYLEAWLRGNGCVPIYNLMEDAATAEISRAQLWQWRKHGAAITDGPKIDDALLKRLFAEEMEKIRGEVGAATWKRGRHKEARDLFWSLTVADEFAEFLTLPAYERITAEAAKPAKAKTPAKKAAKPRAATKSPPRREPAAKAKPAAKRAAKAAARPQKRTAKRKR
jgi:malate synthase